MKLTEHFQYGLNSPICLTWELTYGCNLACTHCLSNSGPKRPGGCFGPRGGRASHRPSILLCRSAGSKHPGRGAGRGDWSGSADLMPLHFLENLPRTGKAMADLCFIFGQRRHAHETHKVKMRHGIDLLGQMNGGAHRHTVLLRLFRGTMLLTLVIACEPLQLPKITYRNPP